MRGASRCAAGTTLNRTQLTPSRFIPLKSARLFGPKCALPYNHINNGGRDLSPPPARDRSPSRLSPSPSPPPPPSSRDQTHNALRDFEMLPPLPHHHVGCKHIGVTPPRPVPRTRDIAGTPCPLRSAIFPGDFGFRRRRFRPLRSSETHLWTHGRSLTANRSSITVAFFILQTNKRGGRPSRVRDDFTILADRRQFVPVRSV